MVMMINQYAYSQFLPQDKVAEFAQVIYDPIHDLHVCIDHFYSYS